MNSTKYDWLIISAIIIAFGGLLWMAHSTDSLGTVNQHAATYSPN